MTDAKKPDPEELPPWQPDRVWAVPTIITIWVWIMGWLPHWAAHEGAGFPPGLTAVGGCLLGLVLVLRARQLWDYGEHLAWVALGGQTLAVVIGAAAGCWLYLAATTGVWPETPILLGGAGLLAVLWWTLATVIAPRATIAPVKEVAAPADEAELMRRMLDRSGMGAVEVLEYRKTRAGQTWEFGPKLTDAEGQPLDQLADFTDFTQYLPRLTQQLAVLWRKRGVQFEDGDIRPEAIKVDRWYLHLNSEHVEKQDVPVSAAPPPRPWRMPAWLGLYLDGPPMEINLAARHGKVVGSTGMGKGVVANNLIRAGATAASGSRREVMVWVLSTDKLTPLVWPWLTGYLSGRDAYPVIDWVAGQDPLECLRMLAAAYRLSRLRNDELDDESKLTTAPDRPGLLLVWDEGNDGGRRGETITLDGVDYTISRLFNTLLGNVRSSGVSMWAITQQGLYEGLGPWGDEMMRNFTIRVCTATETMSDGIMNLPKLQGMNVDTTLLRDHTVYVQPSMTDDARAMPGKMSHLDGTALIDGVVRQIAAMTPPAWSAADLAALGPDYELRWHPERVPTLYRACQRRGWTWRPEPPDAAAATRPAAAATPPPPSDPGVDMDKRQRREAWPDGEPVPVGATSGTGLPGEGDLLRLEALAKAMEREANEMTGGDPVADPAPVAVADPVLSEPMASVARVVDGIPPHIEWVATAWLCEQVWGTTGPKHVTTLGRAIGASCAGLRATDPRSWSGGRGRGYVVTELRAAMARLRHGE